MRRATFIKKMLFLTALFGCICLAGCGGKEGKDSAGESEGSFKEAGTSNGKEGENPSGEKEGDSKEVGASGRQGESDSRDSAGELTVAEEVLFPEKEGYILGIQFFQGEAVQLRCVDSAGASDGRTADIYLDRADGSSELLYEGLPDVKYDRSVHENQNEWYMVQDGSVYCIARDSKASGCSVTKRDADGNVLYTAQQDLAVYDICQLAGGEVIVMLRDNLDYSNTRPRLGELDQDTGAVRELSQVKAEWGDYVGAGAESLLILNSGEGVAEVNMQDGARTYLMDFAGTAYNMEGGRMKGWVRDFRVTEDGGVELLWHTVEDQGTKETLAWGQVDKIPVVMRGFHFENMWIKDAVAAFNNSNDTYHIILEPAEGDLEDFTTQTSVQIAAGAGPDLLYGEILSDSIQGMLDKGGFENLAPYMEASGIKEEDYFPLAFSTWRSDEKIYGVNVTVWNKRYIMDASILGDGAGEPDIGTLVDALYAYEDKAMYMRYYGSQGILRMFLEGSENLWGMVDWEQNSCDFSGELFAKMLEVARRYPYDEYQEYPVLAEEERDSDLFSFLAPSVLEEMGKVQVGVLFDDGCYPAQITGNEILSVNANSSQKQGAWEFIAFLLGEERQQWLAGYNELPVNRKVFREKIEADLKKYGGGSGIMQIPYTYSVKGKYVTGYRELPLEDVNEEWVEAFTKMAEETRTLPVRTEPVLDIICDEAEDYFNGMKSVDEVVRVMENRIRLFLSENAIK